METRFLHIQYLILIKDNSICHLYISILFPPWKYHMLIPVHPYTWSRTHTSVYTICFQAYTDILSRKLSLELFILSVRVADKGGYRDSMIDFRLEQGNDRITVKLNNIFSFNYPNIKNRHSITQNTSSKTTIA